MDPLWSILPPMYLVMWAMHPLAVFGLRTQTALVLTLIWSYRLTYSYFRREEWKFGTREDWRYYKMSQDFGKPPMKWYVISFFAVGIAQHPMIVGISLPLYSVCFGSEAAKPFGVLDFVATFFCLMGLMVAYFADN